MGRTLHKIKKNSFRWPKFPWLMFHVIPVLKMSVHASYIPSNKSVLTSPYWRKRSMFLWKPSHWIWKVINLKKSVEVMIVWNVTLALLFAWVLMTGPEANQNPSITWCTHCSDLQKQSIKSFSTYSRKNHVASIHDYQWWVTDASSLIFTEERGRLYTGYIPAYPGITTVLLLTGLLKWILNSSISRANHIK